MNIESKSLQFGKSHLSQSFVVAYLVVFETDPPDRGCLDVGQEFNICDPVGLQIKKIQF